MDHKINDFFFGEFDKVGNQLSQNLGSMKQTARLVDNTFFTNQLKRLLEWNRSYKIVLTDSSTRTNVNNLLNSISVEQIGLIKITKRKDVNPHIEHTLACEIYFDNGVIEICGGWSGCKESYLNEAITSLLEPLKSHGLIEHTALCNPYYANSPKITQLSNMMDNKCLHEHFASLCRKE